ncbi:MAG: GAF domain-containing protein [Anaerolineae bacterium]|nr:GAF domain-containing protein [Anaerolineae bacterium]
MLKSIKRGMRSPAFLGHEEKTRTAWMLNIILWAMIAVEAVALLVLPLLSRYDERPLALIALTIGLALNLLMQVALRRGRVGLVVFLCILEVWALGVAIVYQSGTIRTPAVAIFVVTILLGAVLGSRRAIIGCAVWSLGTVLVLSWAEIEGYLPSVFVVAGTYTPAATTGLIFTIVTVLLLLVHYNVSTSIAHWQRNERELANSNRALEAVRASLEEQVAERTASVEAARHEAEVARLAVEAQAWQTAGLVELSDAMRGVEDMPTLASQVIGHLCRYLGAPVGALLVKQGGTLHVAASYACAPRVEDLALGESLAGQVVCDGQPIVVHDVPEGYMPIVSGLGTAAPHQLVVWPLPYEGRVLGVVELGLLEDLSAVRRQFLEHVTERVAIVLHAAQARARIDALLAETQTQAGEPALRESEMRAINEELQGQAAKLCADESR